MEKKIITLIIICLLVVFVASTLSEKDYCKKKLGCVNWKKEFKKCQRWCTQGVVNNYGHKIDSMMSNFLGKLSVLDQKPSLKMLN